MISFKDFLGQYKKKYVCLRFTEESSQKLMQYALVNGFDLTVDYDGNKQSAEKYDFHITVFYTTSTHYVTNQVVSIKPFKVNYDKLDLLGENKDVPVIKLKNSGQLKKIRELFEQQGFQDSWPNYLPHISMSYNKRHYDLSEMELPDFEVYVDSLSIMDQ